MAIDRKYYSGGPIGNFHFHVAIYDALSQKIDLALPVDAVRGLNSGNTNMIWHRNNGFSSTHLTPHAGLTTTDPVTIEGTCLYFMEDAKRLKEWHDQVTGKINVASIGGEYRDIVITPGKRDEFGASVPAETDEQPVKIRLVNCVISKLSISDFDANAPGFLTWSVEIRYERQEVE